MIKVQVNNVVIYSDNLNKIAKADTDAIDAECVDDDKVEMFFQNDKIAVYKRGKTDGTKEYIIYGK